MKYKDPMSAESLGIRGIVRNDHCFMAVLDKDDSDSKQVILVPFMWENRQLVDRADIQRIDNA